MISYLLNSGVLLALLLVLYKLLLEQEKMHRFNRFFLLTCLIAGLSAPLFQFGINPSSELFTSTFQQAEFILKTPANITSESIAPAIKSTISTSVAKPLENESSFEELSIHPTLLALVLYLIPTFILLLRFFMGLIQLSRNIRSGTTIDTGVAKLVLLNEKVIPHSFFRYIFLNKDAYVQGNISPQVLAHEISHIRGLHSLDVLFIEILKIVFWFNPVFYFYKKTIQLSHEFIADDAVLRDSSNASDYKNQLLKLASGKKDVIGIASYLNYSLTRKRLVMMTKRFSPLRSYSKLTFILPLFIVLAFLFCTKTEPVYGFKIQDHRNLGHPMQPIGRTGTMYYSDTILKMKIVPHPDSAGVMKPRHDGFTYSEDESLFTGTQRFSLENSDVVAFENIYEKGLRTGYRFYDEKGALVQRGETIYEEGNRVFGASYDKNGNEIHRIEQSFDGDARLSMRMYSYGNMTLEMIYPSTENSNIGTYKTFHENGALKFEMPATNSNEYNGLMTLYNEQGEILEQELYKNNELVEKIK